MKCDRREFIVAVGAGALAACNSNCGNSGVNSAGVEIGYRIRLTGLLGTSLSGTPQGLDVFLVDGQQTLSQPHVPFLVIPTGFVTGGAATKDDERAVNGVDSLFWKLDGYQINFEGAGAGPANSGLLSAGVTSVLNHRHPGSAIPDPQTNPAKPTADEDDATWIANMTKVPGVPSVAGAPFAGAIHPSCRATDPRSAKVAARAHVSAGYLAARFEPKWRDKTFQFGAGSGYTQALSLAEVRMPKAYTSLTISLLPFDPSLALAPKTITVTRGSIDVVMDLKNAPADAPVTCTNEALQNLHHFSAYYQLLDPASTTISGPMPQCVGTNCPLCAITNETDIIYCPPANYSNPSS